MSRRCSWAYCDHPVTCDRCGYRYTPCCESAKHACSAFDELARREDQARSVAVLKANLSVRNAQHAAYLREHFPRGRRAA